MIRKLSYLLLLCLFSMSGCQHAGPSEESFIKKYQQAHEKKDIDAALNLVHMQGVGEDIRQNLIGSFKDDFKLEIDKLEMVPVPKDQMTEYTAQGKTFIQDVLRRTGALGRLAFNVTKMPLRKEAFSLLVDFQLRFV